MSSKQAILKEIRDHAITPEELPRIEGDWIRYSDPYSQFQSTIEGVGGRCLRVASLGMIRPALAELPHFSHDNRVVSLVPAISGNVDLTEIDDPHQLETVDWAFMPAEFGVAENGAVWLTDAGVQQRAIYFIVQHLALVIPADQIVHNMHEAYERIALGGSSLGIFISGPSKTADIEQSLVIGAHGPRSLTVFCVENWTS